ncbi:hypothetical protein glysoja_017442 [Glycine soja]|nr:hypothetical protein glysoja_017442 [Glycine soja]
MENFAQRRKHRKHILQQRRQSFATPNPDLHSEKRRRTSPCETHPFVDSSLPHTQSTPLSESTLTANQKQ